MSEFLRSYLTVAIFMAVAVASAWRCSSGSAASCDPRRPSAQK